MEIREGRLDKILGKGRYHSVIATSYNIDPLFISKVFIPILHSKRIRNIIIITDPKEFYATFVKEEALSSIKGSSTIIIPANCDRLFHPKLMYFIGEKEGLCVVGSGNLTHSGMGGNSEIWGAFHCSKDKRENAHIFQQAWKFLREYIPDLTGTANAKSKEWIIDNAIWLKDILSETYSYQDKNVFLLVNSEEQTIWNSLEEIIRGRFVNEIIIVSPFYDKQGSLLKKLNSLFPAAKKNMIYDKQGTVPESTNHFDQLKCYSWQDIQKNKDKDVNGSTRLHAKLIYLKEKEDYEYLIFGSSNATRSGFGINTDVSATNVELSLFAKANSNELRESLGINLDDLNPESFKDIEVPENSLVEPADVLGDGLRPVYAEQETNHITIVFNQNIEDMNFGISLFDRYEKEIQNLSVQEKNLNTIQYIIDESKEDENIPKAFYLTLNDNSCIIPIYHYRDLTFDNPDSRSELLRHTLSDIGTVDFGSLYDSFLGIFIELEERRGNNKLSSSQLGSSNDSGEENQEETCYTKDELEEKSSRNISYSNNSFISDGILALLSALNKQFTIDKDKEVNREAIRTDSSEEIEHDEQDNSQEKKPDEILNSVKGYRNYFNRVIRYYRKFLEIYDRNSEEGPDIDKNFVMNWLLVISICNHIILENARTEPLYAEDSTNFEAINKKTTIPPHDNSEYTSVSEFINILIPRIVGYIQLNGLDLEIVLDGDQLIEGAINVITLLHLKHWKEKELSTFRILSKNVLRLFNVEDENSLKRFKSKYLEYSASFLSEEVKINDWRYYTNFKTNIEHFISSSY